MRFASAPVLFRRFVASSFEAKSKSFRSALRAARVPHFAWPKKRNQKKGHPSSAPSAHPCAEGTRESVGVFGQAIPVLSKTLAASLRPTLQAIRPPHAASLGPSGRALAPARRAGSIAAASMLDCHRKPLQTTSLNSARTRPFREQAPRRARCVGPPPSSDLCPTLQARLRR